MSIIILVHIKFCFNDAQSGHDVQAQRSAYLLQDAPPDNIDEQYHTDEMLQFKKQNFEDKFNDACFGESGKCEVTYSYDEFASLPIEK